MPPSSGLNTDHGRYNGGINTSQMSSQFLPHYTAQHPSKQPDISITEDHMRALLIYGSPLCLCKSPCETHTDSYTQPTLPDVQLHGLTAE
jgi:hypothetical protein